MRQHYLPEGHNHTTKRFKRTMNEAFLCDAEAAETLFKEFDVLDYGVAFWMILVVLLAIGIAVIAVTA